MNFQLLMLTKYRFSVELKLILGWKLLLRLMRQNTREFHAWIRILFFNDADERDTTSPGSPRSNHKFHPQILYEIYSNSNNRFSRIWRLYGIPITFTMHLTFFKLHKEARSKTAINRSLLFLIHRQFPTSDLLGYRNAIKFWKLSSTTHKMLLDDFPPSNSHEEQIDVNKNLLLKNISHAVTSKLVWIKNAAMKKKNHQKS